MSKPKKMQFVDGDSSSIARFTRYKYIEYDKMNKINLVANISFCHNYKKDSKIWNIKISYRMITKQIDYYSKVIKL